MLVEVLMGQYPEAEAQRRKAAVRACASSDTELRFTVLKETFYDNSPGGVSAMLIVRSICEAAVNAERTGADAVVPFGTLDPGVEAARHFVEIPVVGAGEAGFHLAAILGQRIGVVCYKDGNIPNARNLAQRYHMTENVVSFQGVNIGLAETADHRDEMRKRLVELSRNTIERDQADVIYPKGVSMVPVHYSAAEISAELGVPVVDALAASISLAELLIRTGVKNQDLLYPRAQLANA